MATSVTSGPLQNFHSTSRKETAVEVETGDMRRRGYKGIGDAVFRNGFASMLPYIRHVQNFMVNCRKSDAVAEASAQVRIEQPLCIDKVLFPVVSWWH